MENLEDILYEDIKNSGLTYYYNHPSGQIIIPSGTETEKVDNLYNYFFECYKGILTPSLSQNRSQRIIYLNFYKEPTNELKFNIGIPQLEENSDKIYNKMHQIFCPYGIISGERVGIPKLEGIWKKKLLKLLVRWERLKKWALYIKD